MSFYRYGDYVVYDPGYCEPEIGRYVRSNAAGSAYVCYSDGCTAACTEASLLRPATDEEIAGASPHIGHHRFDAYCPDYDESCCSFCVHAEDRAYPHYAVFFNGGMQGDNWAYGEEA